MLPLPEISVVTLKVAPALIVMPLVPPETLGKEMQPIEMVPEEIRGLMGALLGMMTLAPAPGTELADQFPGKVHASLTVPNHVRSDGV